MTVLIMPVSELESYLDLIDHISMGWIRVGDFLFFWTFDRFVSS